MSGKISIVAFDQHGSFAISDPDLLESVGGGIGIYYWYRQDPYRLANAGPSSVAGYDSVNVYCQVYRFQVVPWGGTLQTSNPNCLNAACMGAGTEYPEGGDNAGCIGNTLCATNADC